jgi:hypothetical protein
MDGLYVDERLVFVPELGKPGKRGCMKDFGTVVVAGGVPPRGTEHDAAGDVLETSR